MKSLCIVLVCIVLAFIVHCFSSYALIPFIEHFLKQRRSIY